MPALTNIVHLLTFVSLALVALSPSPANALVADRAQVARHVHAHDAVAKRRRSDPSSTSASGRCNPRPTSSLASSSSTPLPTSAPTPSSTPALPSSTTTSSATPTPSSGSGNGSHKKWGLAWGADPQYLSNFLLSDTTFFYNWSPDLPDQLFNTGLQRMIMLWGYDQTQDFQQKATQGYGTYALGPNEVNEPTQSYMSTQDAVTLWMQYMAPLKQLGYTLVSPSCTDDQSGLDWYSGFFQLCGATSGCTVDVIAFHAYTTSANDLITYATTLHNSYGLPVMITEFADQNFSGTGGQPDMNQVWDFAGQVVDFVNNTPWILGAFPFGLMTGGLDGVNANNALMNSDGTPTDLAYYYFTS